MPIVESAINWKLRNTTDVTDIVGSGDDGRVYPGVAPRGVALSYITFERNSQEWERHAGGPVAMAMVGLQLTSWGSTHLNAHTLAEAVRVTLESLEGSVGSEGNEVTINYTFFRAARDVFDRKDDGSDTLIYGVEQDYDVRYAEALTV